MAKGSQQTRKKYGWIQSGPKSKHKPIQGLNKSQERTQKKRELIAQQKALRGLRRGLTNYLKVIGVVALQENLQALRFVETFMVAHGAARLELPGGQAVFKTPGKGLLVTFQEIQNIDQCFTVDAYFYIGLEGKEEAGGDAGLPVEAHALKLNERPSMRLIFREAAYLAFLLGSGGPATMSPLETHADPNSPEIFRTTENFLYGLEFSQVPWLKGRFYMNVLGFEFLQSQNLSDRPQIRIHGAAHGALNFGAQCLYLTNYGDQLAAEEITFYDLEAHPELNQLVPIEKETHKIFRTPENSQYKEKLSSEHQILKNDEETGTQLFKNIFYATIDAPDDENEENDEEGQNYDQDDDQTDQLDQDQSETTEPFSEAMSTLEADYERKRRQFKTAEEQLDFPDELDINPESSLKTILKGFHSMKSLRNSVFPAQDMPQILPGELRGLYDVRQPVQLQQAFVHKQADQIEFNGEFISLVLTLDYDMNQIYGRMLHNAQELLGPAWEGFDTAAFAEAIKIGPTPDMTPKYQSLIGLFQHETRYSVCHVRVQRRAATEQPVPFTYASHTPWEVRVGFRRLYTIPTPYIPVGPFRGKLLRFYGQTEDLGFAFVAPIFLTRDAFPPVLLTSDVGRFNRREQPNQQKYQQTYVDQVQSLRLQAQIVKFSLRFQILERVTLVGSPFRISRTRCVVRDMFFRKDDVEYFGRERLETSEGVQGRILRTVTEKGFFKAKFDAQPGPGDTIHMRLHRPIPNSGAAAGLTCELCPGVAARAPIAFEALRDRLQRAHDDLLDTLRDRVIQ